MNILDRYIAREFWKAFFGSLIAFITLFMSADAVRQGFKEDIPPAYALQYTLYQLPELIVMLLPAACLMGALISLSSLSRKNELIAMFAAAVSLARVAFVILCLVFIICCTSFIITDRVIPPLAKIRAHFYRTVILKKPDLRTDINQSKIWYRSKNFIYNLRTFNPKTSTIYGISIYTFDENFQLVEKIDAKRATFKDNHWNLQEGLVTIFQGDPTYPLSKQFQNKPMFLLETPEDFQEIEKEVETLRLKYLWCFIKRNREAGIDTNSYEVLFWSKISMSLVPIVMAILAIPFGIRRERNSSMARDVTICFFLIVAYWLFFSTALSLGKSGSLPPILAAWLPSFVFFVAGILLIRKGRQM